ncbi:hypothetical protein, partial [Streptomyces sp. MB09-02B]|uniref:hypothetical protein n=1 Tax=Streptomyces sp. MB09-02B TaxID=3028667 RepID=UPI0029B4897D
MPAAFADVAVTVTASRPPTVANTTAVAVAAVERLTEVMGSFMRGVPIVVGGGHRRRRSDEWGGGWLYR